MKTVTGMRARNHAGVGKEIVRFFCDENSGTEDLHEATTFQLDANVRQASDCNHEEADTRLILHSLHARQSGSKNIMIRTVDTDVLFWQQYMKSD